MLMKLLVAEVGRYHQMTNWDMVQKNQVTLRL